MWRASRELLLGVVLEWLQVYEFCIYRVNIGVVSTNVCLLYMYE
jgi:hypothetical protein